MYDEIEHLPENGADPCHPEVKCTLKSGIVRKLSFPWSPWQQLAYYGDLSPEGRYDWFDLVGVQNFPLYWSIARAMFLA